MNKAATIQRDPFNLLLKNAVHNIQKELKRRKAPKLLIYTSQYRYKGDDRVDITVKTGNKCFAPTWGMVWGIKKEIITKKEYENLYTEMMYESIIRNQNEWIKLLSSRRVVLVCFCKSGSFCHRIILANMLSDLFGAKYIGELKY